MKKLVPTQTTNSEAAPDIKAMATQMINNAMLTRTDLLNKILDGGGKDLDKECGYPSAITTADFDLMYAREGVGTRVVNVWPSETWSTPPSIYEVEDETVETEFEKKWEWLNKRHKVLSVLERADTLSGIGRFGIILLGVDDSKTLDQPIDGSDSWFTEKPKNTSRALRLLYLRTFQESVVTVSKYEEDPTNPRYGLPVTYNVTFQEQGGTAGTGATTVNGIHWSRVLHLCDNREMSDIYGTPRMQKTYNRLLDVRKILGGSGEMFWKGGFPGLSFELSNSSDNGNVTIDKDSVRSEVQKYMLGLQRYIALEGLTTKSLSPQVADPKNHLDSQLQAIAISEGIPKRILFGSEQGELASSQDSKTWLRRVAARREKYVSPFIVEPFLDRCILLGVLPLPKDGYTVAWPDINTSTDKEKAEVVKLWTEALSKYVQGDIEQLIPVEEFLSVFCKLPKAEITQIITALKKSMEDNTEEDIVEEEEPVKEAEQETPQPVDREEGKKSTEKKKKGKI